MAYGWLPDDDDVETLVDYAKTEQVARVFVGSGDELAADRDLDIEEVDTAEAGGRR
jgi:hypothetical protein